MNKKWKITAISDTHTKHDKLTPFLPGGDLLICGGDITSRGYLTEIENFAKWFDKIDNYDTKIFIAGNHDFGFQDDLTTVKGMLTGYKTIEYLQDELLMLGEGEMEYIDMLKVWGTPWQPEFHNWAFNLPRGEALKEKWDMIPMNTDILITHGPPFGKLDYVNYNGINVGCEELMKKVEEVKPKIHIFGHIHEGYGYVFDGHTHYINAAVLNGRYEFRNKPVTFEWDPITNNLEFIQE
jgi:Icc-related predicted phosphoesterase